MSSTFLLVTGDNGNATDGITRDKILNQPVLEEGTFLSYASKVCNNICDTLLHIFYNPYFVFRFNCKRLFIIQTNQADIVRTLLNCGADPAVQNANGHNAVDVASNDAIRRIYIEELLRATAASEYINISTIII
jgi:hypothetical protein